MTLMLRAYLVATDWLAWLSGVVGGALMAVIAVLMISEVGMRALFNHSLTFAWEYAAYCMGGAVFLGAAFTLRSDGHIRVNLLIENVPAAVGRLIDMLCTVIGVAVCAFLTHAMTVKLLDDLRSGSHAPTPMETPLAVSDAAIAAGLLLLTLLMVARLIRLFLREPPELDAEAAGFQVEK
jgi:TRAP-type C4-dicarboxylate transport system permease small subunit